jgi:SagB-type dehydrogenase family enzyme
MQTMRKGIGETFQEETKYFRNKMLSSFLNWSKKPDAYKEYQGLTEITELPDPSPFPLQEIWTFISLRRSRRNFIDRPLTQKQISLLLWATQGITFRTNFFEFRATPSAGGLFPIETYLVINHVENLASGIYHYKVKEHALEKLKEDKYYPFQLASAALNQDLIAQCGVTFIWTAVIPRTKWKYRERCYRYIYLDAGHIGENLYLAAEALGLGCCTIGAFYDEEINQLIGIDGIDETVVYLGVIGNVER